MGRLSSHFVVIIDLVLILCGMLYDIIRIKLLRHENIANEGRPCSETMKNVDDA